MAPGAATTARLTATAAARPTSAAPQPARMTRRLRPASSAASAAIRIPPVTQYAGRPGPPGLSSTSDRAGSPGAASPGAWMPASSSSRAGWVTTRIVHGNSSTGGTTAAMPRLISEPRFRPMVTAATTAAATAITQISGTNAAHTATTRPAAQAARRAAWRGWVKIRAAASATSGSRMNTAAVPIRPARDRAHGHRQQRVGRRGPHPGQGATW